jgi:NAD(P)-dependent dehydrogenase (short-subunit alcohol dehydrogenase family)
MMMTVAPGAETSDGRGIVVTGAGSGIGAALARRLAARGDRLVLGDLTPGPVTGLAAELGALAVVGDCASQDGVRALIGRARARLGRIDVFMANAGIGVAGGPEAPEDDWARAWDTNVMGHVRAARELLPDWLDAGAGHFVSTVSAAGLLSMPGSAPYAVTKHAAQAFAEYLAFSYGHRGIRVQAICPQGVRTPLLAEAGAVGDLVLGAAAISAEQAAEVIVTAMDGDSFLILPHPEVARYYAQKAAEPDRWITTMQRAQSRIDTALGP